MFFDSDYRWLFLLQTMEAQILLSANVDHICSRDLRDSSLRTSSQIYEKNRRAIFIRSIPEQLEQAPCVRPQHLRLSFMTRKITEWLNSQITTLVFMM